MKKYGMGKAIIDTNVGYTGGDRYMATSAVIVKILKKVTLSIKHFHIVITATLKSPFSASLGAELSYGF